MTNPGAVGDLPQVVGGSFQPFAHESKSIHAVTLRQNLAECNRQYFPADERQNIAMPKGAKDYRRVLRDNLLRCLQHAGKTRETLGAVYLDGTKKGKKVALRTITNMLNANGPSPRLDAVAAVGDTLGDLMPWQLLVPGMDPENPPIMQLTEDERKLYAEFQRLKRQLLDADKNKGT